MIIVIGQPRSGTMSVADALTNMGYNAWHVCPLVKEDDKKLSIRDIFQEAVSENFNSVVSWRLTPYFHELRNFYKNDEYTKFIFCSRSNKTRWKASLSQFGYSDKKIKYLEGLELDLKQRNDIFFFDIDNHGYFELCSWIDHDDFDPTQDFPHSNKSENIYSI